MTHPRRYQCTKIVVEKIGNKKHSLVNFFSFLIRFRHNKKGDLIFIYSIDIHWIDNTRII
jgi:mRNA deadenylase 3'-5' endonuclease subunit Ccr4